MCLLRVANHSTSSCWPLVDKNDPGPPYCSILATMINSEVSMWKKEEQNPFFQKFLLGSYSWKNSRLRLLHHLKEILCAVGEKWVLTASVPNFRPWRFWFLWFLQFFTSDSPQLPEILFCLSWLDLGCSLLQKVFSLIYTPGSIQVWPL